MANPGITSHEKTRKASRAEADALRRCLRQHGGDDLKCVAEVKQFLLSRFKDRKGPPLDSRIGINLRDDSWEEVEALRRCLERHEGNHDKCRAELRNFLFSELWPRRYLGPLRLRRGSLTEV